MSRITPRDLAIKLAQYYGKETTQITHEDLIELYIGRNSHPWIVSEHTFNEKIRLMCALKLLTKLNSKVYRINWATIDERLAEWC